MSHQKSVEAEKNTLKMESVSKITVFGLDMMVNSGLEKIYEIYESVK